MKPIRIFTVLLSSAMLLTAVPAVTARADEPSQTSASGDVPVEPEVDYSKITLEKTSFTFLASNSYLGFDSVNGSTVLKGVPDGVSLDDIDLDYSNTGKKISVYDVYIENNKLCFEASGTGTTTVNVTIGTKKLSFKLTIMGLSLSKRSYMLVKGKSTTVKLKLSGSKSKKGIKITYARKFQVGDLLFETGANNHRYKGIYHVEMFAGYTFDSFNSKGKPVLGLNFANKATGGDDNAYYGVSQKNFLCRP